MKSITRKIYNYKDAKPDVDRWICFRVHSETECWVSACVIRKDTNCVILFDAICKDCFLGDEKIIGDWFYLDEPQKENKKCKQEK